MEPGSSLSPRKVPGGEITTCSSIPCWGNPMDPREAWWATAPGVAKSQTPLGWLNHHPLPLSNCKLHRKEDQCSFRHRVQCLAHSKVSTSMSKWINKSIGRRAIQMIKPWKIFLAWEKASVFHAVYKMAWKRQSMPWCLSNSLSNGAESRPGNQIISYGEGGGCYVTTCKLIKYHKPMVQEGLVVCRFKEVQDLRVTHLVK